MYDQKGNIAVIAAMIVEVANKIWPGLGLTNELVLAIIGGGVAIYGVYHQWQAHKALAKVAGAIPE